MKSGCLCGLRCVNCGSDRRGVRDAGDQRYVRVGRARAEQLITTSRRDHPQSGCHGYDRRLQGNEVTFIVFHTNEYCGITSLFYYAFFYYFYYRVGDIKR